MSDLAGALLLRAGVITNEQLSMAARVKERDGGSLGGVLDLSEMDVSEVMVHRKSISMIDADLPVREHTFVSNLLTTSQLIRTVRRNERHFPHQA